MEGRRTRNTHGPPHYALNAHTPSPPSPLSQQNTRATVLRPGGAAANATVRRDAAQRAPYFNYLSKEDGKTHQVWYDDPDSLKAKYEVAAAAGLAGVGFWNLDCLASGAGGGDDEIERRQAAEMWAAVRDALLPPS